MGDHEGPSAESLMEKRFGVFELATSAIVGIVASKEEL